MFNYVANMQTDKAMNNLTLLKIRIIFVSTFKWKRKKKRKERVHLTIKILFIVFKTTYFIHYANFKWHK